MNLFQRIPFFVHPVPASAIALMALNDHYLKYAFHSWFTGKMSDFLGMFYFPLFLAALWCGLGQKPFTRRVLFTTMAFTALVFASIKVDPNLTESIQNLFSQWVFKVRLTNDPTDLIALFSFAGTYAFARRFFSKPAGDRPDEVL